MAFATRTRVKRQIFAQLAKHGGPGPHKNGSPQTVHDPNQGLSRGEVADSFNQGRSNGPSRYDSKAEARYPGYDQKAQARFTTPGEFESWKAGQRMAAVGDTAPVITPPDSPYRSYDQAREMFPDYSAYYTAPPAPGKFDSGLVSPETQALIQDWEQRNAERFLAQQAMPDYVDGGQDLYRTDDLYGAEQPPDFFDPLVDQSRLEASYFQDPDGQITLYADELAFGDVAYGPTGPFRVENIISHGPPTETGSPYTPPADLPLDMMRVEGTDANGEYMVVDLFRDQIGPPRIPQHTVNQVLSLINVAKHYGPGPHKNGSPQSIHGNWSRGTSSRQLMSLTRENEGSTTGLQTGDHPTEGFAVALHQYGQEIPADKTPTADDIKRFITSRWSALTQPNRYLGTWLDPDTGSLWLDVTEVHDDFSVAEEIARAGNEIAIFDLATFETHNIDYGEVA